MDKTERADEAFSELMDLIAQIGDSRRFADVVSDLKIAETVETDADWHGQLAFVLAKLDTMGKPALNLRAKVARIKGMRR